VGAGDGLGVPGGPDRAGGPARDDVRRAWSCGRVEGICAGRGQLDPVAARFLTGQAPLLPATTEVRFVDIEDTVRSTYGYAKQGAGYGYSGVKGFNAFLAIVSTPASAPVIAATRLRKGSANSARGAARCRRPWPPPGRAGSPGWWCSARTARAWRHHAVSPLTPPDADRGDRPPPARDH
jgi:hypothetical protein